MRSSARPDQRGNDVRLEIGETEDEVRPQIEDLRNIRRGEGRYPRLLATCLGRAHAISRDADDAVLFTEHIERFDGFLAEADDPLRRKHRSNADLRLGWQMHEQHAGRAADRAGAMA